MDVGVREDDGGGDTGRKIQELSHQVWTVEPQQVAGNIDLETLLGDDDCGGGVWRTQ